MKHKSQDTIKPFLCQEFSVSIQVRSERVSGFLRLNNSFHSLFEFDGIYSKTVDKIEFSFFVDWKLSEDLIQSMTAFSGHIQTMHPDHLFLNWFLMSEHEVHSNENLFLNGKTVLSRDFKRVPLINLSQANSPFPIIKQKKLVPQLN